MKSKEALEKISWRYVNDTSFQEWYEIIKQELDKLEKLEKENQELKELYDFKTQLNRNQYIVLEELNEKNLKLENGLNKLKKVIEILKEKLELPLEDDFDVVKKDEIHLYRLRIKCLINEEEYEILKEYL